MTVPNDGVSAQPHSELTVIRHQTTRDQLLNDMEYGLEFSRARLIGKPMQRHSILPLCDDGVAPLFKTMFPHAGVMVAEDIPEYPWSLTLLGAHYDACVDALLRVLKMPVTGQHRSINFENTDPQRCDQLWTYLSVLSRIDMLVPRFVDSRNTACVIPIISESRISVDVETDALFSIDYTFEWPESATEAVFSLLSDARDSGLNSK